MVKTLPANARDRHEFDFLGQKDPLEKKMVAHSSILAQRKAWTEEPSGLQSMGQIVGHD